MSPCVNDHDSGVTRNGEPALIRSGKTGIKIPKPSRSIKTVVKMASNGFRRISLFYLKERPFLHMVNNFSICAFRSCRPFCIKEKVTTERVCPMAFSISAGVPKLSLVPLTQRIGILRRCRCSVRGASGLAGAYSGYEISTKPCTKGIFFVGSSH